MTTYIYTHTQTIIYIYTHMHTHTEITFLTFIQNDQQYLLFHIKLICVAYRILSK